MSRHEISTSLNEGTDSQRWIGDSIIEANSVNGEDAKVKAAREERRQLGSRETQAVRSLRLTTLFVLLLATVLLTIGVYKISRNEQEETFRNDFDSGADKIIESFHKSVQQVLDSFDAVSTTMTSYALDTGATFPNVTIPHFETRGAISRIMSQSFFLTYTPLVTDENRAEWEAYADSHHGHIAESYLREFDQKQLQDELYGISVNGTDGETSGANDIVQSFRKEIWGTSGFAEVEAPATGPYLPSWQFSPAIPVLPYLNFNVLDLQYFRGPCEDVLRTGLASFGLMSYADEPTDEGNLVQAFIGLLLTLGQYRHTLQEYIEDPITMAAYPVFDKLTPTDRQVVGVLSSSIYWRMLFKDILPEGEKNAFTVVVQNTLGQAETFRLNGAEASYVGEGDLHDPELSHMETTAEVADYLNTKADPETRSFTSVELRSKYVSYSISVYPNKELESYYLNDDPTYYAIVVASTFLFTAIVFMLYNLLVERRQRLVLDKAAKSTAVVKSLFPENVQDRLYKETEENARRDSEDLSSFLSSEFRLAEHRTKSKTPIADLFSAATIIFADLVGFTKWSSGRKPTDVFGLLETIYRAFDSIAKKRGVFKVETIGDCYVAVTGLPEAQPDHAVRMTKFAAECMCKLRQLLPTLADTYGTTTRALSMRIGLHSGPVTAGVLRGDRGRFQLFGDTVNTAARMESNGSPGRIHCSESTASELREASKESWVRPRETEIVAKGKGRMQTFWVVIPNSGTAVSGGKEDGESSEAPPLGGHDSARVDSLGRPMRNYLCDSSASTDHYESETTSCTGE